jgi:ribosome-binding factor A
MSQPGKINEILQPALAAAVNRELELPNVLVTVSFVKCSQDLKYATVGVSVLPAGWQGTALKKLRQKAGVIAANLKKTLLIRRIPQLRWVVDATENKASSIEAALAEDAAEIEKILKK